MELIKAVLGIFIVFLTIEGGVMISEMMRQPKAIKKIGKRRLYVKWNEERQG